MARKKKKDSHSITKGYGARYGVRVRKRIEDVLRKSRGKYCCPECQYIAVKRVGTAIWMCRHCGLVFAGGAYQPVSRKTRVGVREEEEVF
ncbi:MAG TPA: 50S ribosomal protein L37ae [Thermoplasmata archaeon]|nr:50S ribosomal protein L37ae [Thermoplasmata archaeon]